MANVRGEVRNAEHERADREQERRRQHRQRERPERVHDEERGHAHAPPRCERTRERPVRRERAQREPAHLVEGPQCPLGERDGRHPTAFRRRATSNMRPAMSDIDTPSEPPSPGATVQPDDLAGGGADEPPVPVAPPVPSRAGRTGRAATARRTAVAIVRHRRRSAIGSRDLLRAGHCDAGPRAVELRPCVHAGLSGRRYTHPAGPRRRARGSPRWPAWRPSPRRPPDDESEMGGAFNPPWLAATATPVPRRNQRSANGCGPTVLPSAPGARQLSEQIAVRSGRRARPSRRGASRRTT